MRTRQTAVEQSAPFGLVTPQTGKESGKKTYAYDRHCRPSVRILYLARVIFVRWLLALSVRIHVLSAKSLTVWRYVSIDILLDLYGQD